MDKYVQLVAASLPPVCIHPEWDQNESRWHVFYRNYLLFTWLFPHRNKDFPVPFENLWRGWFSKSCVLIYHWSLYNYRIFRNATVLNPETESSPGAKSGKWRKTGLWLDMGPLAHCFW